MNDQSNSLGNVTGGGMQTGNPQDIGTQNISNAQTNIQTGSPDPFTNPALRITDENGNTLSANTSTTTAPAVNSAKKSTPNHNAAPIIIISGLIIAAIFIATWIMNRNSNLASKV